MNDVVLFVDFFVNLLTKARENHSLPNDSVEQPEHYAVLNDGPADLSDDVRWISEDVPSVSPKGACFSFGFEE